MRGRTLLVLIAPMAWSFGARAELVAYLSFGYGNGGRDLSEVTGGQSYGINAGAGFSMTAGASR